MSIVLLILIAIAGWMVGAGVWILAGAVAGTRPLTLQPVCPACGAGVSSGLWLSLIGFGLTGACPECGSGRVRTRLIFQLMTAVYFVVAAIMIDDGLRLVAALAFFLPLSIVALLDIWIHQVFSNVIALGIILGVGFAAADGWAPLKESLQGLLAGAGIIAVFYFLAGMLYETRQRGPVGLLDILLGAMIGAMVRWPLVVTALFVGSLLAALLGITLLFIFRSTRRPRVLYGPFLCAGALLVLLYRF